MSAAADGWSEAEPVVSVNKVPPTPDGVEELHTWDRHPPPVPIALPCAPFRSLTAKFRPTSCTLRPSEYLHSTPLSQSQTPYLPLLFRRVR